jgi:hypothetical protein
MAMQKWWMNGAWAMADAWAFAHNMPSRYGTITILSVAFSIPANR